VACEVVKPLLQPGAVIDGFRLDERVHLGGMAALWRVSKPGLHLPMLMKVPFVGEGADPASIVSFEMEQMILPRLSGRHVPRVFGVGDFAVQPYVVMEHIEGSSLLGRLEYLPLPYADVAQLGVNIANALDDLHRQHVVHLDVKPSNIMLRPSGDVVLLDFGLSHHQQLPDLMQEEFRVPFGTAPYMSPEQLKGIRNDPRSDQFALGVLLYFFSTGIRPFGEGESLAAMRKRLWRDPVPPRKLKPDYPLWLQEIVLRLLEPQASWRYPSMAQLAFDLSHPDQVRLTTRSEKLKRDPFMHVLQRRFNTDLTWPSAHHPEPLMAAPIVAVAVDLAASPSVNEALRYTTKRILATVPAARLACINVNVQHRIALDTTLDAQGHNKHLDRLVALRHWAEPLKLDDARLTVHVFESTDPAGAILEFANNNAVDHILMGARDPSLMRSLLGSVSSKVASEAACSVTIVRPLHTSAGA
jgi:eukaryotic-like serine/threonine-protein kinase